jgi:hypothetical protein
MQLTKRLAQAQAHNVTSQTQQRTNKQQTYTYLIELGIQHHITVRRNKQGRGEELKGMTDVGFSLCFEMAVGHFGDALPKTPEKRISVQVVFEI